VETIGQTAISTSSSISPLRAPSSTSCGSPGEVEELLGHPVDVVSTGELKDRDRHILAESVDL
jgi:hypothetical protein